MKGKCSGGKPRYRAEEEARLALNLLFIIGFTTTTRAARRRCGTDLKVIQHQLQHSHHHRHP